jgi:hypothetical protein
MAHNLIFAVRVTLERLEGKFAPKDELADKIIEMIEQANDSTIDGVGADGESVYDIVDWDVLQITELKQ